MQDIRTHNGVDVQFGNVAIPYNPNSSGVKARIALAMSKNFIVHADHCAIKNGVTCLNQIIELDHCAVQGADESQAQSFPTKMDGDTVLLAL
ncbi:MAG: hypothetical protein WBB25_20465 [Sulfitobacter sp.]